MIKCRVQNDSSFHLISEFATTPKGGKSEEKEA